ncbi:hypothetical protein FRC16_004043 [Serendipita sp. 398]|nr:hypothetical protein FRC16_004043 [Serendipita sp. 398]
MFKRSGLPLDATGACVQIFDGRWILYRRPDHICVRHVYAKSPKETFDVKILSYARYEFKLGQIDKNLALIGVRHDIRETWSVMEMTLGDHPGVKPSMKLVPLEEVGFMEFVGGPRLVIYSQGALRLVDVHTLNRVTIANVVAENQRFVFHDRSLFSVFSRPGGLLQLSAYGIWEEADGLKRSTETRLILSLKEACVSYPPDKFFTETNIRSSSTDGIVTIWHRVHMKVGDDVFYATFIIEVPYIRLGESHDERVYLGKNWTVRSTYIANGTHVIGNKAQSSLLSRFRAGDALLTAYPRLNIPRSHFRTKIVNRGISLPVPDGESCNGSDVHSIRTAWDDVHGIAVLYFNSGLIWILHYA